MCHCASIRVPYAPLRWPAARLCRAPPPCTHAFSSPARCSCLCSCLAFPECHLKGPKGLRDWHQEIMFSPSASCTRVRAHRMEEGGRGDRRNSRMCLAQGQQHHKHIYMLLLFSVAQCNTSRGAGCGLGQRYTGIPLRSPSKLRSNIMLSHETTCRIWHCVVICGDR